MGGARVIEVNGQSGSLETLHAAFNAASLQLQLKVLKSSTTKQPIEPVAAAPQPGPVTAAPALPQPDAAPPVETPKVKTSCFGGPTVSATPPAPQQPDTAPPVETPKAKTSCFGGRGKQQPAAAQPAAAQPAAAQPAAAPPAAQQPDALIVQLHRPPDGKWGFTALPGQNGLEIRSIDHGALEEYNEKATDKVKAGDKVIEANGASGSAEFVDQAIKAAACELTLKVIPATVGAGFKCCAGLSKKAKNFEATLNHPPGFKYGFAIDQTKAKGVPVLWVHTSGLIPMWNAEHPDKMIQAGDEVVECNGKTTAKEILEAMGADGTVKMKIQKAASVAKEFFAVLDNTIAKYGMQLKRLPDGCVMVEDVLPDGCVAKWNAANPEQAFKKGDRITEVDGVQRAEIMSVLQQKTKHALRVQRP